MSNNNNNAFSTACIANNTCFPLDPCVNSSNCRNGRYQCNTGTLMLGTDFNDTFGQCESTFSTGSILYFTANILLFALFWFVIFLYYIIPIVCCFRFIPCLKKKDRRRGGGGAKKGAVTNAKDGKATKTPGPAGKGRPPARQSRATSKAMNESPPDHLPNLRTVYQASKLASTLVSHDMEDGDGVVLATINSRALAVERAQATKLFRTCALLGALLDINPDALANVEPQIAASFAEAHKLVLDGLRSSTPTGRAKQSLDRATLLWEEIIRIIVSSCFPVYDGAEDWVMDGHEHKKLDEYVVKCQDILDTGAPERSCMEICRRTPAKHMPDIPPLPQFTQSAVPSHNKPLKEVAEDEVNEVEVNSAKSVKPASDDSTDDLSDGSSDKLGLVMMASEMCQKSMRNFDTSLLSSRKMSLAVSSRNFDVEAGAGTSNARLTSNMEDAPEKESMLARLGRTVSRMQTERALVNILATSPAAAIPDLDKLFQHADLCADLHDGAKILTLSNKASEEDRMEALRKYRIAALFCKLMHLDPSSLSPAIKEKIGPALAEGQALMTEGMKGSTTPERASAAFKRASLLFTGVTEVLTAPDGPFHAFPKAAEWTTDSVEFLAFDEYVHDCILMFEDEPRRTCLQSIWHRSPLLWRKFWQIFGIPDSMRNHPFFYFVYLFTWGMFVIRFFVVTCDIGRDVFDGNGANLTVEVLGTVPAHVCLQTKGRTYLGVGPQYTAILGKGNAGVDIAVPLLFGIMHSLLFVFGSIPVTMARGFWRDVSYWIPITRRLLPIDDHIFVHKFLGYLALFNLFWGACLWIGILGVQECFNGSKHVTCTAFDPENIKVWFNLFENVVMLRVVVIGLWFWGLTWMRYQTSPPKYWFFGLCCFKRLPTTFRQHFFEYAYILHVTIAIATFILAEAARFQVFYPVMATWFLYILDSWREVLFMTFRCDVEVAKSTIHIDPSDHNRPTTLTVRFENPWRPKWRGGCIKRQPSQGAGMWVFVKIPAISNIEWHPFSLASADGDDFVQLQIGIRPGVSMGWRKPDNWVLDKNSALAKVTGEDAWIQKQGKTWTYKLYELLLNTQGDTKIPCKIRGPYGSSFRLCFSKSVRGALIMGAGTGLSAVESMLRAVLHRKQAGKHVPNHVWVCWQARRVGDLLWCWDSLNELLIKAVNDGIVKKPLGWTPASKTLGFLRITFFISRSESVQLDTLRGLPKRKDDNQNIHEWLTSNNRIIQSSISNEGTHISKYIRHIRAELNRLEDTRKAKLGISFCGPSAVSKVIANAAADVGGHIEFSSDATA